MKKKNSFTFVKNAIESGVAIRDIKGKQEDWKFGGMYVLVKRLCTTNYAKMILLTISKKELFENFFEPCGNEEYRVVTKCEAVKRMRVRWQNHRWGKEA